jgi:hypothetical protein
MMTERHFYIDEAGDLSLFSQKKVLTLGENGRSRFFMVGIAELGCPQNAKEAFAALRQDLLRDPSLCNIPSLQRTARHFHCKDDFQAVRREVFNLMTRENHLKNLFVAIKDKRALQQRGLSLYQNKGEKLSDKAIYQDLVSRLLKNLLHKSEKNTLIFSHRGKTVTNASMREAVEAAQQRFLEKWGISGHLNHHIICAHPEEYIGLQLVDYAMWALQRLYERGEDYWFSKIRDHFKIIMDIDDVRHKSYGEWYSANNPLSLEKVQWRAS